MNVIKNINKINKRYFKNEAIDLILLICTFKAQPGT